MNKASSRAPHTTHIARQTLLIRLRGAANRQLLRTARECCLFHTPGRPNPSEVAAARPWLSATRPARLSADCRRESSVPNREHTSKPKDEARTDCLQGPKTRGPRWPPAMIRPRAESAAQRTPRPAKATHTRTIRGQATPCNVDCANAASAQGRPARPRLMSTRATQARGLSRLCAASLR